MTWTGRPNFVAEDYFSRIDEVLGSPSTYMIFHFPLDMTTRDSQVRIVRDNITDTVSNINSILEYGIKAIPGLSRRRIEVEVGFEAVEIESGQKD